MNECLTLLAGAWNFLVADSSECSASCSAASSLGGSIMDTCICVSTAGKFETNEMHANSSYLLCSRWFILGGLSLADGTVSEYTIEETASYNLRRDRFLDHPFANCQIRLVSILPGNLIFPTKFILGSSNLCDFCGFQLSVSSLLCSFGGSCSHGIFLNLSRCTALLGVINDNLSWPYVRLFVFRSLSHQWKSYRELKLGSRSSWQEVGKEVGVAKVRGFDNSHHSRTYHFQISKLG